MLQVSPDDRILWGRGAGPQLVRRLLSLDAVLGHSDQL